MKIVFINTTYGLGSTGQIVKSLSEEAIKHGDKVLVLFGRGKADKNAIKISNKFDTYLHALFSRLFDANGYCSVRATKKAIKLIRTFNPDVIHLNNLHGYYLNIPIFLSYLKEEYKGKIVWTLHDCWILTGRCAIPGDCEHPVHRHGHRRRRV